VKIAYLVFAYKNPLVLKRLITRLSSDESTFFIHIDQKSSMRDFSQISGDNIIFLEQRWCVHWAEYSGVQAILSLIRFALHAPMEYGYFVLLSGSEYPLRSREYIHSFFQHSKGAEYINMVKMPNETAGKPISRINGLYIQSNRPFCRIAVKALTKTGLGYRDYRKYLANCDPYAGNTWWALTRDACRYIERFVESNKIYEKFFQSTFAPEEMFFHTILGNSHFAKNIKRNIVYEDWSARGSHPAMISGDHISLFEGQEKILLDDVYGCGEMLFSRKFSDETLDLLRRIDDMIDRKDRLSPN
jgi:hypothetical protein